MAIIRVTRSRSLSQNRHEIMNESAGAFLGISVSSPYYSRQRISHYLTYARLNFPRFAFLIGDEIFRFTLAGLRNMPIDQALARARTIGDEREIMLKEMIRTSGFPANVMRWSDVIAVPQYSLFLSCVSKAYQSNQSFKNMVRKQVFINLGERVTETGLPRNPRNDNEMSGIFDSYILEEVAGLITVCEYTPYRTEIYPGRDLRILQLIYNNKYPEITEVLPLVRKRRFLQLRID